ncbi:MAG: M48 family metallopeptidase [Alphaproteobacteria bacterium]|nr:M48 family metallopeptidase [Alphaproteobacteria bacterium]
MPKKKTVYDHIHQNNVKTAVLVLLFPLIFIALVFLFTWCVVPINDAINTTISVAIPTFIGCLIWMGISWAFGDAMMLSATGAHEIHDTDPQYREVFHAVENVALAAGLPCPHVYIIDDDSLNAFATGRTPRDASVALTRGIIKKLDRLELEGVIAHECAHIGNRDIRLDMLIITGIGVTVFAADLIYRVAIYGGGNRDNDDNKSGMVMLMVWLAFTVFNTIITPLLQLAVSRSREYAADATGAKITRNPMGLANALRKISGNSRSKKLDNMRSLAIACIAEPRARGFMGDVFSTHPSTEKRISRLESMV